MYKTLPQAAARADFDDLGEGPVQGALDDRVTPRPKPRHVRVGLGSLAAIVTLLIWVCWRIAVPHHGVFNWYFTVMWSMYFPIACVGLIGVAHKLLRNKGSIRRSEFTGRTGKRVIFNVPSLCREDTTNALRRVIASIQQWAPQNLDDWEIHVVTEEALASAELIAELRNLAHVRVLVVPTSYETPKKARFKTRANQYAMELRALGGEDTSDCYVYHIDDDTHVGSDTVASLAEFICNYHGEYYLAQGILAFPRELTTSSVAWMADAVRPGDDLTRFSFFTGTLGRPWGGLHGEHIIIRADIEASIGWDYPDTVIEDAYFGLQFCERYPGKSTTLNSFSYGASPSTVRDFVRQRRRWIEGLLRLTFNRNLRWRSKCILAYTVACWALSPLQSVGLVLVVACSMGVWDTAPVVSDVSAFWAFSMGYLLWQYVQGLKVNIAASAIPMRRWWRAVLIFPGVYLFACLESWSALLGIIRFAGWKSQKVSEVIAKPI